MPQSEDAAPALPTSSPDGPTSAGSRKQQQAREIRRAPNGAGVSAPAASRGAPPAAHQPLSDQELIDGIRRASEAHFNELYSRYFQRIYNFVYGRIRNHADAEEIVQETFMVVFSSIENYRGKSSLLSWIYGIAKNTANNSLRTSKNQSRHLQEMRPDQLRPSPSLVSGTPEERLTVYRYLLTVRDQLEDLGRWQTEIFEMRHLQNLSISEISERTDRSSDSVRSSLYRVKRLLMETAASESPPSP